MADQITVDVIVVELPSAAALVGNLDSVMRFVGPGGRLFVVNNSPEEDVGDVLGWDRGADRRDHARPEPRLRRGGQRGFGRLRRRSGPPRQTPDARVISGHIDDIEKRFLACPDAACCGGTPRQRGRLAAAQLQEHADPVRRRCREPRTRRATSDDRADTQHAYVGLASRRDTCGRRGLWRLRLHPAHRPGGRGLLRPALLRVLRGDRLDGAGARHVAGRCSSTRPCL